MRPLKLKMTAFGPYRDVETIDFTELKENKLFVISGNTGSGKTTIFDGISFALYGSASGEDRDNYAMLRSDFADDDVHTAVELEFALQERRYRVLRQLGHVKDGNKTRTGERYEFYEVFESGEVPAVDRQIVTEIDAKIESLIGLSQDQFKQIVMLPQGEFRKFLTSTTENKEAILRRLFKTEPYQQITAELRERKGRSEKGYEREKQSLDHYVQTITAALSPREASPLFTVLTSEFYNTHQVLTGLAEEILFYEEQTKQDEITYQQATKKYEVEQARYHQAHALNERFLDLATKEAELIGLQERTAHFDAQAKQIKAAEQAQQLTPYEEQLAELKQDVTAKNVSYEQAQTAAEQANKTFADVSKQHDVAEGKQPQRDQLRTEIEQLRQFLPRVQEIDARETELARLKKAQEQLAAKLTEQTKTVATLKETIEAEAQEMAADEASLATRLEKQAALTQKREQVRVLMDFSKYTQKERDLTKQLHEAGQKVAAAKAAYEAQEKQWLSSQASILATHLHDGEACPVCGSDSHPAKATAAGGGITRDALDQLRQTYHEHDATYRQLRAEQTANGNLLQEKRAEVEAYEVAAEDVEATITQLVQTGKALNKEVERLEKLGEKFAQQKVQHEEKQRHVKTLEATQRETEQTYQAEQTTYQAGVAVFKERMRDVPEEIKNLDVLKVQIEKRETQREAEEQAWVHVQKALQTAREQQARTQEGLLHAQKQAHEAQQRLTEATARFKQAITDAEFPSEAAYQAAKRTPADLAHLKQALDDFKQSVTSLTDYVTRLRGELAGRKQQDLSVLETDLEQAKVTSEAAFTKWNRSKQAHTEAVRLQGLIKEADEAVRKREQELGVITDLFDVIRGQNSKKISFERYLQITYLEQIIEAANYRLKKLSNGQFFLIRSDRQESHGRQSGLALDVYDSYTGQTRDVKTLSGGEKFNASLCLALGMSDVIQSFQGNVSIKTMFIDEGFGTLDEESLRKSIDILIDLQKSGRMIGIISHVEELKTIFPAVLEVTKTPEGNSQTRFMIK